MAMRSLGRQSVRLVGAAVLGLLTFAVLAAYQAGDGARGTDGLTLDPSQFEGDAQQAYEAAQKHPGLLAQLHCYCGCEEHEGHKNLLDCFRTDHAAGCASCIGEAVTAAEMREGGSPADQIAEALRKQYGYGD